MTLGPLWIVVFFKEKWRIWIPIGNDTVYAFGTKDSSTGKIEETFLWS
jgi:hypothetical protein